jgi:hypothetical protein
MRPIPAAWAAAQWRQFWPHASQTIDCAVRAVPAEHQELVRCALDSLILEADCRGGMDMFGRHGWPADDEEPGPLDEWALDEMAAVAIPAGGGSDGPEYAAAMQTLAGLDRSVPAFRAQLLQLSVLMHRYGDARIWVTPGDHQATLHSAQAYFALPPDPWMADDDGRLCVFHEGRPERVTADGLRVRLDAGGVVRELRYNPPHVLHLLGGLEYPAIDECQALLPEVAARLIVACHEWPHLPRLADIVSSATTDLITAWRAAYGGAWVTAAKIAALDLAGIPGDRVQLGRLLGTLAEREVIQRGKRTSAGYPWRLLSGETV